MPSIRERKTKRKGTQYVVDYYDATGKRRNRTCDTVREAEAFRLRLLTRSRGANPHTRLETCAAEWLEIVQQSVRPQTYRVYETELRLHILPELGRAKVARLDRGLIKQFIAGLRAGGLHPKTCQNVLSALIGVLDHALDSEIIEINPARGLSRGLRLHGHSAQIRPFTEEQLGQLFEAAQKIRPGPAANPVAMTGRDYPLLFTLGRAGLRIGEALALEWPNPGNTDGDILFEPRLIDVSKTLLGDMTLGQPKTKKARRKVDMSRNLTAVLWALKREHQEERLRAGSPELPEHVFRTAQGELRRKAEFVFCGKRFQAQRANKVNERFKAILKLAGLPLHHSAHDLRHTFAYLHLTYGSSPYYVMQQLGHSSYQMTVDHYGNWMQKSDLEAADRLDRAGAPEMQRKLLEDW